MTKKLSRLGFIWFLFQELIHNFYSDYVNIMLILSMIEFIKSRKNIWKFKKFIYLFKELLYKVTKLLNKLI